MSEHQGVEHGLAGGVEGSMQADVAAHLPAAAVLAVDVGVDPGEQQVQTRPDGAGRTGGQGVRPPLQSCLRGPQRALASGQGPPLKTHRLQCVQKPGFLFIHSIVIKCV